MALTTIKVFLTDEEKIKINEIKVFLNSREDVLSGEIEKWKNKDIYELLLGKSINAFEFK